MFYTKSSIIYTKYTNLYVAIIRLSKSVECKVEQSLISLFTALGKQVEHFRELV